MFETAFANGPTATGFTEPKINTADPAAVAATGVMEPSMVGTGSPVANLI